MENEKNETLKKSVFSQTINKMNGLSFLLKAGVFCAGALVLRKVIFRSKKKDSIQTFNEVQIAYTDEWKKHGGIIILPGHYVIVRSENQQFANYYVFVHYENKTIVECTCPAWRYQRTPINLRSCKHCQAVLGEANERLRIKTNAESEPSTT